MHAISSYHGNRATYTQTHRQDRLRYTVPQLASAQCKYVTLKCTEWKVESKTKLLSICAMLSCQKCEGKMWSCEQNSGGPSPLKKVGLGTLFPSCLISFVVNARLRDICRSVCLVTGLTYRDVTCWLILITSTSTAVCDDDDDDDDDDDISAHLYCIWSTTQWLCYAANRACTNCEGSTSGCKVVWCPNVQSFQTCKLESLEMLSRCTQQTYLGRGSHWGDRLLRLTQLTWVGVGGHWGDRFKKAQPGPPSKSLPPYNWGLWNFSCVRLA